RSSRMTDAEADEQVCERAILRRLDRMLEVRHGDLAEAFEAAHAVPVQHVDVGGVVNEIVVEEEGHGALAESFDVHGALAREVTDACPTLAGTLEVRAERVALAVEAEKRLVAHRTCRRELPWLQSLGTIRQHRFDDLWDHVARLAHDHRVARSHVLR